MIKVSRTTVNDISISMTRVAELIREHLNFHGSKETGINVTIPDNAAWEFDKEDDQVILCFRWTERV